MPSLTGYGIERKLLFSIDASSVYETLEKKQLLGNYDVVGIMGAALKILPIVDRYAPTYFDDSDIAAIVSDLEKLSFVSPAYARNIIGVRSIIQRYRGSLRLLEFKAQHSPGAR